MNKINKVMALIAVAMGVIVATPDAYARGCNSCGDKGGNRGARTTQRANNRQNCQTRSNCGGNRQCAVNNCGRRPAKCDDCCKARRHYRPRRGWCNRGGCCDCGENNAAAFWTGVAVSTLTGVIANTAAANYTVAATPVATTVAQPAAYTTGYGY